MYVLGRWLSLNSLYETGSKTFFCQPFRKVKKQFYASISFSSLFSSWVQSVKFPIVYVILSREGNSTHFVHSMDWWDFDSTVIGSRGSKSRHRFHHNAHSELGKCASPKVRQIRGQFFLPRPRAAILWDSACPTAPISVRIFKCINSRVGLESDCVNSRAKACRRRKRRSEGIDNRR